MRKLTASLLLFTVAVPLGGCSLFGKTNQFAANKAAGKELKAEDFAQLRLTAGREALDKGNWAEAIIALRDAQRYPRFAAQAHNGMGVAWAQLGRADLAERYFQQAISEAPDDRRFAANLSRLYALNARPEPVLAAAPVAAPAPALQPRSALATSNPAIRVERPAGRLIRTAQGELRLQPVAEASDQSQMASAAAPAGQARPRVTFTRRNSNAQ